MKRMNFVTIRDCIRRFAEYVSQPITFDESDFRRKNSVDESVKLDENDRKHEAGVVPFQSESIDFNGELNKRERRQSKYSK